MRCLCCTDTIKWGQSWIVRKRPVIPIEARHAIRRNMDLVGQPWLHQHKRRPRSKPRRTNYVVRLNLVRLNLVFAIVRQIIKLN